MYVRSVGIIKESKLSQSNRKKPRKRILKLLTIALDAMGGDFAPYEVIKGALLALESHPNIEIRAFGPESELLPILRRLDALNHDRLVVTQASDIVSMDESPSDSYRRKKDSSIFKGLEMVRDGDAHAFVSAGNTGAVMMASTLILGRIPNVERPAIASVIPTASTHCVMLDMGSSVDCKPEHLAQFAVMGHWFSHLVFHCESPRIGLLNIGSESEKGNAQAQAAYQLISELNLRFMGNIEGKDILKGKADVVVCDGFVGNSVLKFGEGVSHLFFDFFKKEWSSSLRAKLGLMLLKPSLNRLKVRFDHEEYGGAPLLGVNGVSIIAHGSSSAYAIKNAIEQAIEGVESGFVRQIGVALES